jgi:hypothetical protein
MCALGARFAPSATQHKMYYYTKARALLPEVMDTPSIMAVQAALVLMLFSASTYFFYFLITFFHNILTISLLGISNFSATWSNLGLAIRIGSYLKFDVDPDENPDAKHLSWVEKEARRRCW